MGLKVNTVVPTRKPLVPPERPPRASHTSLLEILSQSQPGAPAQRPQRRSRDSQEAARTSQEGARPRSGGSGLGLPLTLPAIRHPSPSYLGDCALTLTCHQDTVAENQSERTPGRPTQAALEARKQRGGAAAELSQAAPRGQRGTAERRMLRAHLMNGDRRQLSKHFSVTANTLKYIQSLLKIGCK